MWVYVHTYTLYMGVCSPVQYLILLPQTGGAEIRAHQVTVPLRHAVIWRVLKPGTNGIIPLLAVEVHLVALET